jgi:hypothetical protein
MEGIGQERSQIMRGRPLKHRIINPVSLVREFESMEWEESSSFMYCDHDQMVKHVYLGKVYNLNPSGKYYMPWCSNVTEREARKDAIWQERLEKELASIGAFPASGEGDSTDLFAVMCIDKADLESEESDEE